MKLQDFIKWTIDNEVSGDEEIKIISSGNYLYEPMPVSDIYQYEGITVLTTE